MANDIAITDSCCVFVRTICCLLTASFWNEDDEASTHFRTTAVATPAARKMMQLYADPYTRASLPVDPDSSPRDNEFPCLLESLLHILPDDPLDSTALVPGLTVHEIFQIITSEPHYYRSMESFAGLGISNRLLLSVSAKPMAWEAFSVEARASIAHKLLDLKNAAQDITPGSLRWRLEYTFVTQLFFLVFGYNCITETKDEAMWFKVVEHAATTELGPFTEVFTEWYSRVCGKAGNSLHVLVTEMNLPKGFVPPPAVIHILQYALDPFGFQPLLATIPLLLSTQGISSSFVDRYLQQSDQSS